MLELDAYIEKFLIMGDVCPAQVLLDVKAAFPSAAWSWIFFVLNAMHAPSWIVNCVCALHFGSSSQIVLGRSRGTSFCVTSGIKQGCPMSGSLWNLLFDPLFRAVRANADGSRGGASAFADDVGLAYPDAVTGIRLLVPLLDLVGAASCLRLNWSKTVLLNFSRFSDFEVRRKLEQAVPCAACIKVSRCGRYLGFVAGPDAATKAWIKECDKFMRRVRHDRGLGLSLFEGCLAFGVFAFSVLRFATDLF